MADPYFNPHTLYADFQNAYKSVMSRCNLVLNDCPPQSGVAFGLQVQQTAPSNQLNSSILNGENVHNPFNLSRFKQVPVRVIYHQEAGQTEPLELSVKPKAQQTEECAQFHTGQLKLNIDQVWSMAGEASSQSHSNRAPLTSTLNGTAGNSYLGVGQSTPQSSLVVDSNLHHSGEISNQGRIDTVSHPMPQVAFDKPQEDKMLQDQIDSIAHATGSESERTYFQDYYTKNKDTLRAKQLHRNPSDNQSTSSEEIIDDNTPFFDRERERYHEKVQDPEKRKLINQRQRERRADPEKRKLRNQRQRERRADPEKRKLRNQRKRERYHEKVQDPEKRKLMNQRQRERYHEKVQDPEKRKLRNQRQRERRADPEKRKLINQRQRERYHEKVQDPEKRKLINQRKRERRADPKKRKLINQRERERYHEKVQDPEKRKLRNQRQREQLADPEKRKLRNQRERERRADPKKRKLINQRERERYHEKVQDPEKRKLINQRQRERRADPEKRKLINQRQRERRADPEKRKLINQRQQALPAISPSGDISQLSYITEATPTSSTN